MTDSSLHDEIRKEIAYERATRVRNEMEAMKEDGHRDKRIHSLEVRLRFIERVINERVLNGVKMVD